MEDELPFEYSVSNILQAYILDKMGDKTVEDEVPVEHVDGRKNQLPGYDVVNAIHGFQHFFNNSLPSHLLYGLERPQFEQIKRDLLEDCSAPVNK